MYYIYIYIYTYIITNTNYTIVAEAVAARACESPPLQRTGQLAEVVAEVKSELAGGLFQQPARLTFQAIRTHLNREFQQLESLLEGAMGRLAFGGRLAVVCFKRAEVAAVRRFLREHEDQFWEA